MGLQPTPLADITERENQVQGQQRGDKNRGVTRTCAAGRSPVVQLQSCCAARTSAQAVAHSGVVACRANGKYVAQMQNMLSRCPELAVGKVHLGVYLTARKAARAYDLAALKVLGSENADLNVRTAFLLQRPVACFWCSAGHAYFLVMNCVVLVAELPASATLLLFTRSAAVLCPTDASY